MSEIRYDGPDVEADTSGRVQGLAMVTFTAADGISAGRQAARAKRGEAQATRDATDRALWASTPEHLGTLPDELLAQRWQATARHLGDQSADQVRGRLEKELTERDPDTMRDYRSWRNTHAMDPGTAMRAALIEREARLATTYDALTHGRAGDLGDPELVAAWVSAVAAHGVGEPGQHAAAAVTTGSDELGRRMPGTMTGYDALITRGVAPYDAATATFPGPPGAFGPTPTWMVVHHHGVPAAATPHRTVIPATAGAAPRTGASRSLDAALRAGRHL